MRLFSSADDLVLMAESQQDLQVAFDVVDSWALKWRFTFGIAQTKSAVVVCGLASGPLLVVFESLSLR